MFHVSYLDWGFSHFSVNIWIPFVIPTGPTLLYNTDTPALCYPTQFHARSMLSMFYCSRTHAVTHYALKVRQHSHEHWRWIVLQVCTEQHVTITDNTHSHAYPHSNTLTYARTHTSALTLVHKHTHTHTHTQSLKHSRLTATYQCYCTHVHMLKQIPVMFWNEG